jgi:ribosomal protein S18 acetylase RimI-like enzyme
VTGDPVPNPRDRYAAASLGRVTVLRGAGAIIAAAGGHPYVRMYAAALTDLVGVPVEGGVVWRGARSHGYAVSGLGEPGAALDAALAMRAEGLLDDAVWAHLPAVAELPGAWAGEPRDDWDFRWLTRLPEIQPGEHEVIELAAGDEPAIVELMDRAHPDASTRPGHPRIRRWYGIRRGGRLVACGADLSGGIGMLGGVTVDEHLRGRSLGTALTCRMTRLLHAEFGTVSLSHWAGNVRASALYQRLGFVPSVRMMSLALVPRKLVPPES